jgi:guanylate kinase
MVIVVGPSGVGKSSFVEKLTGERKDILDVITYTTRPMREGESEGFPYHFVSPERFKALIAQDFFVEWAEVHGRLYGTPKDQIDNALSHDRPVIMDVDVQGAKAFQEKYPGCLTLFIHPPSMEELRRRIISRESKVPSDLDVRLATAEKEIRLSKDFDQEFVNDDYESSYAQFKKIIEEFLK